MNYSLGKGSVRILLGFVWIFAPLTSALAGENAVLTEDGLSIDGAAPTPTDATTDITQTDNNDTLIITGGVAGNVNQGDGIDDFQMSGGQIQSLDQGGGFDTFTMTGGHIVGTFRAGDQGTFSGGRIGTVLLLAGDNVFTMTGGTIDRNLSAGFGNDTITISGGTIGGFVSLSSGDDVLRISGGTIGGEIRGGQGNDTLIFENYRVQRINRILEWELIELRRGSRLELDGNLTLGDSGTLGGTLEIDANSQVLSMPGTASARIQSVSGSRANVINRGRIDLTGSGAGNVLTITGNYTGVDGSLVINTVLGDDDSATDRLVVENGQIRGRTTLIVNNQGGGGNATQGDGILVVEAAGSTTSEAGAFQLNETLEAGAYEYRLFKGGATAGSEESWYLRTSRLEIVQEETVDDTGVVVTPAVFESVPILRANVPLKAKIPAVSRDLVKITYGTFHDRRGGLGELGQSDERQVWTRLRLKDWDRSWSGTGQPAFDGSIYSANLGRDWSVTQSPEGGNARWGTFLGLGHVNGNASGLIGGVANQPAGSLDITLGSIGIYTTRVTANNTYWDLLLGAQWLEGTARIQDGDATKPQGYGWVASAELGRQFAWANDWAITPNVQLMGAGIDWRSLNDGLAEIDYSYSTAGIIRAGAQLAREKGTVRPFLRFNVWRSLSGEDVVRYDERDSITTEHGGDRHEFGAGLQWAVSDRLRVVGAVDYIESDDASSSDSIAGNIQIHFDL